MEPAKGKKLSSSSSPPDSPDLPPSDDMALVAHNNPTSLLGTGSVATGASNAGINKRYRPAPAKTFQCRGYGECRMVFSRSEHLARHIRYEPNLLVPYKQCTLHHTAYTGNTPVNAPSLATVENNSRVSIIFVNMLRPFTPIRSIRMSR